VPAEIKALIDGLALHFDMDRLIACCAMFSVRCSVGVAARWPS
jgi:hypothetical protein